ncbi:hypothetical protein E4U43_005567, partial [Claviceps pusilla]
MASKHRPGLSQRSTTSPDVPARQVKTRQRQHKWDLFLDNNELDTVDHALDLHAAEKQIPVVETLMQEDSPYSEVRAS